MPARERGKIYFRIARMIQERARELPWLKVLTEANLYAKAAILMCPLLRTFFIMQDGPINWNMPFPEKTTILALQDK